MTQANWLLMLPGLNWLIFNQDWKGKFRDRDNAFSEKVKAFECKAWASRSFPPVSNALIRLLCCLGNSLVSAQQIVGSWGGETAWGFCSGNTNNPNVNFSPFLNNQNNPHSYEVMLGLLLGLTGCLWLTASVKFTDKQTGRLVIPQVLVPWLLFLSPATG